MRKSILTFLLIVAASSCTSQKSAENGAGETATAQQVSSSVPATGDGEFSEPKFGNAVKPSSATFAGDPKLEQALFAGGCFWCMEPPFDKVDGVVATVSGYAGGSESNPKYKQVASGTTGHTEAVLVVFDPAKVTYDKLLDVFWRAHDPTDGGGQFVDRGSQYRPAVFTYDEEQKKHATKSRDDLAASGRFDKPIATKIVDATAFWPAEDYHQDFYKKDPRHYKRYRTGSGRDQFLNRVWDGS